VYGVPDDLPVDMFVGAWLGQICIGPWDLQFHFSSPAVREMKSISVEGRWELRDAAGEMIDCADRSKSNAEHPIFRLQVLLGHPVAAAQVDPPESFTVIFDDGNALTVYDDSKQYESFSIQPGNWFI